MACEVTEVPRLKSAPGKCGRIVGRFFTLALLLPIGIVGVVHWAHVREAEINADLKRDLIARGYGAAEIDRVLYGNRQNHFSYSPWTVEHAKIEANLKRELAQAGLSGEEIERVVKVSGVGLPEGNYTPETVNRARKEAAVKKEAAQTQQQVNRRSDREAAARELLRLGKTMEEIEAILNPQATPRAQ
jgi:hypothetical protein